MYVHVRSEYGYSVLSLYVGSVALTAIGAILARAFLCSHSSPSSAASLRHGRAAPKGRGV